MLMRELKVRILYPSSVTSCEVKAAIRGVQRFTEFGITFDHMGIDAPGACVFLKSKGKMKELLTSPKPTVPWNGLSRGLLEPLFRAEIIGIGLTPERLVECVEGSGIDRLEGRIGISTLKQGAVISLDRIRAARKNLDRDTFLNEGEADKAIEIAVAHELGHVFGISEHCTNTSCSMQENVDFKDFIERFVRRAVDFCRESSSRIRSTINELVD